MLSESMLSVSAGEKRGGNLEGALDTVRRLNPNAQRKILLTVVRALADETNRESLARRLTLVYEIPSDRKSLQAVKDALESLVGPAVSYHRNKTGKTGGEAGFNLDDVGAETVFTIQGSGTRHAKVDARRPDGIRGRIDNTRHKK